MIPRLVILAVMASATAASAQNFGAPRGDYARATADRYSQPPDWMAPHADGTDQPNPMTYTGCPYGYAQMRSGDPSPLKCAAPDDDKNSGTANSLRR